jgi:hypothetical protein
MLQRILSGIAWAELRGRDRGLRGSSGAWLAVWVLAAAFRHLRKMLATDPVVVREELRPGQQLVVTHFPAPERQSRRAKRRARRAAAGT